jgi:hypothetical protein
MYPSRKKFRTHDLPSDPQLWAIGVIIVRWSAIETLTSAFINGLADENSQERAKFESTWSSSSRLSQLVELTKSRLVPPWQNEILDILEEVRALQDLRDKIVHGTWGGPQNKSAIGADAEVFNWTKPQANFSWRLTFGELMRVAYRMDATQSAILNFLIHNADPATGISTLGDVLRSKRR